MKRFYLSFMAIMVMLLAGVNAKAASWPANYQGVMLQGFYWDSYKETTYETINWKNLTAKADELSNYFTLIWVPNSGRANGENGGGNGYMPIYWFTNHNSAYGTETELKTMISTFKAKGVGIIEDCVINHRVGVSNWYNFPTETWKGKTYQLTDYSICSTDEMWRTGGQGCPYKPGEADEGEDFDGARDLNHRNSTVQDNCKDYVKFLTTDMEYAGLRYDMTKGYSGYYTGMYNSSAGVKFSVGEFWDGDYDRLAGWINQTAEYGNGAGKSAAFDFAFKYAVNEAFSSGDMTKLAWKDPNQKFQPAGLVHYGYQQFAVTFVDNHDTYRDGSKFTDHRVAAANAFMLCSPGTPCVFWPHYVTYKSAIQKLINARNAAGIHNQSAVNVLKCTRDCYMAEVTGTKGKLVVKIGPSQETPAGYSSNQIVASGTDYCVWATNSGGNSGNGDDDVVTPSKLYILGNLDGAQWTSDKGITMTKSGDTFSATKVKLVAASGETYAYFTFVTALGANWDDYVNKSDRYGAKSHNQVVTTGSSSDIVRFPAEVNASGANSWGITPGTYDITADFKTMKMTIKASDGSGNNGGGDTTDDEYYVYFNNSENWANVYVWAWNSDGDCTVAPKFPGDKMTSKNGKLYWAAPKGKVPTQIIFSNDDEKKAGGGDLNFVNKATYNPDGTYTTESGDSGNGSVGGDALLFLRGTMNNWGTNMPFTTTDDVNFTIYNVTLAADAEFKIANKEWDSSYTYSYTKSALSPNVTYTLENLTGDKENMKLSQAITDATLKYNINSHEFIIVTEGDSTDEPFTVYFDNSKTNWSNPYIHYWGNTESEWPGVAMTVYKDKIWKYTVPAGTTGLLFNAGDGDNTKTNDFIAVANHVYTSGGDKGSIDDYVSSDDPVLGGDTYKVYFDNANTKWATPFIYYWSESGTKTPEAGWPGVAMNAYSGNIWMYEIPASSVGVLFNAGNGDNTKTDDFEAKKDFVYTTSGPQDTIDNYKPSTGNYPETLYMLGNLNGVHWDTQKGLAANHTNGVYEWKDVDINTGDQTNPNGYFTFVTVLDNGSEQNPWDSVNSGDRYGSEAFNTGEDNTALKDGVEANIVLNAANVSASGAKSWVVPAGRYNVTANLNTMKVKVNFLAPSGVETIEIDNNETVEFYNLQGVRVANPTNGIYLVKRGSQVTKVYVK